MTSEIIGIIAVGITLAGLVLVSNREITRIFRTGIKAEREETNKQFNPYAPR